MSKGALDTMDNAGIALGGGSGTALLFLRGLILIFLRRLTPLPFSVTSPSDGRKLDVDFAFESLGPVAGIALEFNRVVVGGAGSGK
jgi:hypothetical protein